MVRNSVSFSFTVTSAHHLFRLSHAGSHDKSSWGEIDFGPLVDDIWRKIGIRSHHQQRCENYVQMAAMIAKTLLGEKRRTQKAITVSGIVRPCNLEMVEEERSKVESESDKKKIRRVRGWKKVSFFARYMDRLMASFRISRAEISDEQYKEIHSSLGTMENKAATREINEIEKGFAKSVKKPLRTYKAEEESGFERTALMGGKVELRDLKKGEGHEPLINDELIARKIPSDLDEFVTEYGENADLANVLFKEKKQFLKTHEANGKVLKNKMLTLEVALKKTNAIVPVSASLIQFLENQC